MITDYIQAGFSLYKLSIPIPDDTILETSEGYVYLLEVIEPLHPRDVGRIDNTTNVLLVTINDNDGKSHLSVFKLLIFHYMSTNLFVPSM